MKLLSLYYTHKPGGFCKRLYRLFGAAHAASHEVHYCSLDLPPASLQSTVIFHRIPFWTTSRAGLLFWGTFLLWCPFYFAWVAVQVKPDRYVVFGAVYSSLTVVARVVHQAPVILFLRSLVFEIDRITGKPATVRLVSSTVERFGIITASTVVCMTSAMLDAVKHFTGRALRSSEILPNDLPPPQSDPLNLRDLLPSKATSIALTAGVLDNRKNVELLINAWKDSAPPETWALVIAGSGPRKTALESQVKALGLTSVYFLGWVEQLERYLPSAQLYLHPSKHEGVSNSVLEALAADVPVLASDIPEHQEILSSSLLRCNEAQWGERLAQLFRDSGAFEMLKGASRKSAEQFRFDWNGKALEIIIKNS